MNNIKLTKKQIGKLVAAYKQKLEQGADMFSMKMTATPVAKENKIHITFSDRAIEMSRALVDCCDKEIAWNATVTKQDDTHYVIDNVYIFPQIVTGTAVDVDPVAYANWVANIPDDILPHLRCHCHSHVNMGVFSSNVDDDYQKQLVQGNVEDYYIFLIFNKRDQVFARLYDVEHNIFYDNQDIEVNMGRKTHNQEAEEWIEQYVSCKQPATQVKARSVSHSIRQEAMAAYERQMSLGDLMAMEREHMYD